MRFAGQAITIPSEAQNPEVLPNTKGLRYPGDTRPAEEFKNPEGESPNPTLLPQIRDQFMRSPKGGIT